MLLATLLPSRSNWLLKKAGFGQTAESLARWACTHAHHSMPEYHEYPFNPPLRIWWAGNTGPPGCTPMELLPEDNNDVSR